MKIAAMCFIILYLIFISCSKQEIKKVSETKKKSDSVKTFTLTDNQKKVLAGAKKCLEAGFKYDNQMAYHILKYRDGEFTGSKVYPNGDLDPALGVCTDVTIRALRWGGVCDLQKEIHEDIISNPNDYPMSRWNAKNPDANIDHRRVPNQLVWFKKYWNEVKEKLPSLQVEDPEPKVGREGPVYDSSKSKTRGGVREYMPGDIIIWDMDGDSWGDHMGIISDITFSSGESGVLLVIHNFPSPGYVAEEDVLNRWKIIGVFRVKE